MINTPLTSAQGCAWERLICSVRRILSSMPEDPECHPPTEEILRTLFALVQSILNSRPLTSVSCSVDNCCTITPAPLMPGVSTPTNRIGTLPDQASLRLSFSYINDRADKFWQTWMNHYLPFLQKRTKNITKKRNFKVGDIIVMMDQKNARSHYPLA